MKTDGTAIRPSLGCRALALGELFDDSDRVVERGYGTVAVLPQAADLAQPAGLPSEVIGRPGQQRQCAVALPARSERDQAVVAVAASAGCGAPYSSSELSFQRLRRTAREP